MNASEKTTSERTAEYSVLPPAHKAIVRILAVNVDPCAAKRILDCLEELGITCPETNGPYHVRNIQPLQKELIAKGLLLKSNKGLCCPESIRQAVVRECLLNGAFSSLAQAVQKKILLDKPPHQVPLKTYKQYARSMQLVLFSGNNSIEEVYGVLHNVNQYFSDTPPEESIFLHLLARPFSPEVFEQINSAMHLPVLQLLLNAATARLEPIQEVVDYMITFGDALNNTPEILTLIFSCLLCGDTDTAALLIKRLPEERQLERLSRTGWMSFLAGQHEEARAYFEQNLQLVKKISRQKKPFFKNEQGLFHLLTLLEGNERALLNQGMEYIEIIEKNRYYYAFLMPMMKSVFQQQLGMDTPKASTSSLSTLADQPLPFLIFHLLLLWTSKTKAQENIPALEVVRDKAKKNGYT